MSEKQSDMDASTAASSTDMAADAAKWKALARKHEDASKDANAQLDKLRQQVTDMEAQLKTQQAETSAASLKATRFEIAAQKGLPLTAAANLTGDTPEAIAESADSLLSTIQSMTAAAPAAAAPPPVPTTADKGDAAEIAHAFLGQAFN